MGKRARIDSDDEWGAVWFEVGGGSDRSAAIVAQAALEHMIGDVLRAYFVDDSEVSGRVLRPGGRDLELKRASAMAFAVGVITRPQLDQLYAISSIRNHFAHDLSIMTMGHSALAGHVDALAFYDRFIGNADDKPRARFNAAVGVLAMVFADTRSRTSHRDVRVAPTFEELVDRAWSNYGASAGLSNKRFEPTP